MQKILLKNFTKKGKRHDSNNGFNSNNKCFITISDLLGGKISQRNWRFAMTVTMQGNNIYHLKGEKIHKIEAKSIWGIIGKAIVIAIKEFWSKM